MTKEGGSRDKQRGSKMPVLPTGLVKHKNGTYYLRRRIPADLRFAYPPGKLEINQTTGTRNYKEAVDRFHELDGQLQAKWRGMRQKLADDAAARHFEALEVLTELTEEDIQRISEHVEAVALAGDEMRREEGTYAIDEIEEYKDGYSAALPVLKAAVAVGDAETLSPLLDEFLYLHRYDNRLQAPDYRRLVLAYGRAAIRANEKLLRRYEGEEVPTPKSSERRSASSVTFADVAEQYIDKEYASGRKLAMAKKVNLVVPMLVELLGKKPISDLKQSDINYFFELVHKLWPRWADEARRTGKSWVALAKSNEDLSRGEIAPGTFEDTYRAVVRRFLGWAITNYQDQGFPTSLTVRLIEYRGSKASGENRQRAFKVPELKRLFEGPAMQGFAKDPSEHHRFWLPHVGLFTGARVNELCQLHPRHDVQKDAEGVWFFKITEEGEEVEDVRRSVKTGASRRLVPIHSALIKLGFIEYVERQRKAGAQLLFSPFKPSRGRASGEAEKWFRGLLEELGLRDETPGARLVGMHAFRSTLLNKAMNDGIAGAEVITGHAHSSKEQAKETEKSAVVRGYEGEMSVASKSKILEQIRWPEIKFIKPASATR
ncbi:site-specific integrase [Yanghanlia caeni]|uniref:Site-specific integrase n=1 Tax=Yanghanlia caeni TaxID=3064283 RepID=A0ABU1D986_9BURK|nr:site-specific integrase [Alcaligenaceae bacterium LG-2]